MPKVASVVTYKQHKAKWKDCQRCNLCSRRSSVVLVRGQLPAAMLLIGEAPGESEDTQGIPFVKTAPAGGLLQDILESAGVDDFALTNLVGCIPRDENYQKVIVPPADAVKACAPRIKELITLCKPRGIVWVGKESFKWGTKLLGWEGPTAEIIHPAAIHRMSPAQQGLAVQKCVVAISDLWDEINANFPAVR